MWSFDEQFSTLKGILAEKQFSSQAILHYVLSISQVSKVVFSATYANARRLKLGLKIAFAAIVFLQCFMGNFDVTARINMASAEEFFVNPYSFEPEYASDEASSTSSDEDDGQDDRA